MYLHVFTFTTDPFAFVCTWTHKTHEGYVSLLNERVKIVPISAQKCNFGHIKIQNCTKNSRWRLHMSEETSSHDKKKRTCCVAIVSMDNTNQKACANCDQELFLLTLHLHKTPSIPKTIAGNITHTHTHTYSHTRQDSFWGGRRVRFKSSTTQTNLKILPYHKVLRISLNKFLSWMSLKNCQQSSKWLTQKTVLIQINTQPIKRPPQSLIPLICTRWVIWAQNVWRGCWLGSQKPKEVYIHV